MHCFIRNSDSGSERRFSLINNTIYKRDIIKVASKRQKWIDQGQSVNIFMEIDKASGKYLNDIYMLAWELGLKSTYYLRSQSPDVKDEAMDRSIECYNCQ